jgi:hypothetical protein
VDCAGTGTTGGANDPSTEMSQYPKAPLLQSIAQGLMYEYLTANANANAVGLMIVPSSFGGEDGLARINFDL